MSSDKSLSLQRRREALFESRKRIFFRLFRYEDKGMAAFQARKNCAERFAQESFDPVSFYALAVLFADAKSQRVFLCGKI